MNQEPLVSIVTPVYNEAEYLGECIESVLAQTYDNWDYTVVDNCSTDTSLEIALRYAAKDKRIRVHRNERFLEMLANHNVAIRQISATSKYCKVVLADDWIFPQCLERMVAVAEKYPSVGIVSAYEQCGRQIRIKGLPATQTLVAGREACRQFLLGKLLLFGSQNSVLYRSDLVKSRDPFYDESNMYADFESCFALLSNYDLGFVHDILTFSRQRPRSVGAVSADLGANFGSILTILFKYGKGCLSEKEYEESLERYLAQYYSFLARRAIVERNSYFWRFHKATFAMLGIDFSTGKLAKSALIELGDALVHPRATLGSVRRLFTLRKIRNVRMRSVVSQGNVSPTQHTIQ